MVENPSSQTKNGGGDDARDELRQSQRNSTHATHHLIIFITKSDPVEKETEVR